MNPEIFKNILREAKSNGVCSINLGWNAEPILNKNNFLELLDILDNANILDIFIHTNAVNLDEEIQRRILNSKIKTICFSLGSITDETRKDKLQKITENILNFKKLRDELKQETPMIRIGIIPTKTNLSEIQNYIELILLV